MLAGRLVMVWTVDADPLIDRFLADHRVGVLITIRRRAALGLTATPWTQPTARPAPSQ